MSDDKETTEERVAEPTAVKAVTPTGPVSRRSQLQQRFDAESPAYVHVWMDGNTPIDELEMNGYQRVKWGEGKSVSEALRGKEVKLRKDVLCKIRKDTFAESRKQGEDMSRQLVEQSMRGKDKDEDIKWQPRNLVRKPKDARDIGKPAN